MFFYDLKQSSQNLTYISKNDDEYRFPSDFYKDIWLRKYDVEL